MSQLDRDTLRAECRRVLRALVRWLEIRRCWGPSHQHPLLTRTLEVLTDPQLLADIDHSDLLPRLLAGYEPLPIPPPTSYGYPWWELVENGVGVSHDVWEVGPDLVIDQYPWRILERVSDGEFIVTYGQETQAGYWRVSRMEPKMNPLANVWQWWRIERVVLPSTQDGAEEP